jgi:hypothetical protein
MKESAALDIIFQLDTCTSQSKAARYLFDEGIQVW